MKLSTLALAFGFIISTLPASFADTANAETGGVPDAYYQVKSVSLTEVVPTAAEIASGYLEADEINSLSILDLAGLDWNQMILIGEKVIEIIKRGAPVVNIKRDTVSVIPFGAQSWQQLAGWQAPVTKVYKFVIQNNFDSKVVDARLKVSSMWGGNIDGRGMYLANVQIVPTNVRVLWGWNLDLWSENREPVNSGSALNPVAGLGIDIRYKATTPLVEINGTQDYFVTGDGKILEIN